MSGTLHIRMIRRNGQSNTSVCRAAFLWIRKKNIIVSISLPVEQQYECKAAAHGGFAASLSASRYKSVSDKFKQRPSSAGTRSFRSSRSSSANGNSGSNMDRFHAHLRASLRVSKLRASGDNSLLERKQQDNHNEDSASTTSKKYNRVFRISRQDAAAERKKEGQDYNRTHDIRTSPTRQKKSNRRAW